MINIFQTSQELAADKVNCGCGCGDWGAEYLAGLKAGVNDYWNPTTK